MEEKRIVNVGIIGCGRIANSKHMPGLASVENVRMIAFCDLDEEKALQAKEKFGTQDAKIYTDYKELLKNDEIEVVHVCTPNRSHSFISIDALYAKKHVMVEKPMAKTAKEAREMVAAAKATGMKLTVGYQNRCRPEALELHKMVQQGRLGEIYYAKALAVRRRATPNWGVFLNEYEQGGGPLIDIGTHALDLTLYMMNDYEPKMVVGKTYKKLPNPDCGNVWGPWNEKEHTVEDSAFGFIIMKSGATINLESSWALNILHPVEASTMICGTKAGAEIVDKKLIINFDKDGKLCEEEPEINYTTTMKLTAAAIEAKQWIDAVVNDTDPCVLPEQACVVSEILEAIYISASKGGEPVYFD